MKTKQETNKWNNKQTKQQVCRLDLAKLIGKKPQNKQNKKSQNTKLNKETKRWEKKRNDKEKKEKEKGKSRSKTINKED
jgi:hypothetical protein